MTLVYIFAAAFIAWIWMDYFRYIGGYAWRNIWQGVIALGLGAASTELVSLAQIFILDPLNFGENGVWWNDLLYSIFGVGTIEEFAKTLPFLILLPIFRKQINQPIQVVALLCTSALGFSALENVYYLQMYGGDVLDGRAVLAAVGHMCDSALTAYGFVLFLFRPGYRNVLWVVLFYFLASISHGIYDFWLIWESSKDFGFLITILYFFFTISFFATIVNNSLNNGTDLDYRKGLDPYRIGTRLGSFYIGVFILFFIILTLEVDAEYAGARFHGSLIFTGFIILVTGVRLSRMQLIKGRWNKLRIEFPFLINLGHRDYSWGSSWRIKVRGYPLNDTLVDQHLETFFEITPLTKEGSTLMGSKWAYLEGKQFLKGDRPIYPVRVYLKEKNGVFGRFYLIRRISGKQYVNDWPIMGLVKVRETLEGELDGAELKNFKMMEWVVLRPGKKGGSEN